ncbi:MAG TPA: hypothetical protein VIO83_05380 [Pseudomonas sp.]
MEPDTDHADLQATRQWQARFDLPGAPPLPPTPEFVPSPVAARSPQERLMAYAGDPCPQTGRWQAPRLHNRIEAVERGQPMPGPANTETGAVIWYLVNEAGSAPAP